MAVALPARAAVIRGDDFQHAIGWCWASRALTDPAIHSVSIEDVGGGSFDDLVVRRRSGEDSFWQIKTSNYGSTIVDEPWLMSHATGGRSPLQHSSTRGESCDPEGDAFELVLLTNRSYDPNDPLLGELRDLRTEQIDTRRLNAAGTNSKIGKARARWIDHLETDLDTLIAFLLTVSWKASTPLGFQVVDGPMLRTTLAGSVCASLVQRRAPTGPARCPLVTWLGRSDMAGVVGAGLRPA
jgi:hypothetical protein